MVQRTSTFHGASLSSSGIDDVISDVFLLLVKSRTSGLGSYEGNASLDTWLRKVVISRTINYLRTLRKPPKSLEAIQAASADDPPLAAIRKETFQHVNKVLSSLEDRQRMIVKLFFFEHKKYREIAEILRMPLNSVGPVLARALAECRNRLKPDR